ncbi:23 kDa integral membrane protein-like [Pectinophora gossypiella]|uniref:Tetraspanin n=1 Tax=Pectinophora gossypiella TaxID=13191 RepID=A0A1E1W0A4_PECGO|nr:23 kDa integral membrane protein-like [Pectinophora gossypiella]
MGCGEFLVKYILFFANLFFALAGLTLLGIGIAVQLKVSEVVDILDSSNVAVAPISAMVVGAVVFVIAFFGCCGAIRESNCMLVTYSIFMIILMVLKITLATMIFVNLNAFIETIPKVLNEAFTRDPKSFENLQSAFQCCGTTGPGSYNSLLLPDSCCATTPCTPLNSYGGCNDKMAEFINTFGLTIGIVAIGVGAVELLAVIFGLCLANHARNKDRRARY